VEMVNNQQLNDEKRIALPHTVCLRCGATWIPRVERPLTCPKCRSPYYNRARRAPSNVAGGEKEKKNEDNHVEPKGTGLDGNLQE